MPHIIERDEWCISPKLDQTKKKEEKSPQNKHVSFLFSFFFFFHKYSDKHNSSIPTFAFFPVLVA